MKTSMNNQDTQESHLKEVQIENELLLTQVHQLQEELEHYFYRNQELEKGKLADPLMSDTRTVAWVDDELLDMIAENQRLHALVEVLQKSRELETNNALNVKLGNILIQGVDSLGSLLAVPGKIGKIWRESSRKKNSPNALGGKGFEKVIAAYNDGGFKAVEKLLTEFPMDTMQANGYTILARYLMKSDRDATAEAARRAYEHDPQPFRLKWLVFRLHEAGGVIEAEAMLDTLPKDIKFSESETRQATQLRYEAKHVRKHQAKQKSQFWERRTEVEKQVAELKAKIKLEKEENEKSLLKFNRMQEELERQYITCQILEKIKSELEQEKSALAELNDVKSKLVSELHAEIEQLKNAKCMVDAESKRDIEVLQQAQAQLEQEKTALVGQNDVQSKQMAELQSEIEQLKNAKRVAEVERKRDIEVLQQAQAQLEIEKSVLASQNDQQSKLAEERLEKIKELQQQTQTKQVSESELSERLKMMREEMARAEAQLDLIKDVLLREAGL